jgi:hypothetical protein
MDIEITELKSREICKILELFPQGHLEIKFERIFWSSDYTEPSLSRDYPDSPQYRESRKPNVAQDFSKRTKRMADVLGSMMG